MQGRFEETKLTISNKDENFKPKLTQFDFAKTAEAYIYEKKATHPALHDLVETIVGTSQKDEEKSEDSEDFSDSMTLLQKNSCFPQQLFIRHATKDCGANRWEAHFQKWLLTFDAVDIALDVVLDAALDATPNVALATALVATILVVAPLVVGAPATGAIVVGETPVESPAARATTGGTPIGGATAGGVTAGGATIGGEIGSGAPTISGGVCASEAPTVTIG